MPARTCARALTHKRAEEISEAHPRACTHARAQPSRTHHKTRMVSPPRCPNRHMATGGLPPTIHLTRATAPGPAHRRYHYPTARASTGRFTRRAPSPATPAPAGHPSGRQAAAPAVSQGNARTPTLAPAQAAAAHTQAHVFARTSLAGAGYGGRRGGGHGGATRGAHNKRESQAPSREATKHAGV